MDNDIKYRIKALRVGKGFKAGEFAKKVGISREYLRLIENGKAKRISKEIMIKIASELNSDVITLFFSNEN